MGQGLMGGQENLLPPCDLSQVLSSWALPLLGVPQQAG